MEQAVSNSLGTERIGKLLVRFGVPSIISLVVNSLYNIRKTAKCQYQFAALLRKNRHFEA